VQQQPSPEALACVADALSHIVAVAVERGELQLEVKHVEQRSKLTPVSNRRAALVYLARMSRDSYARRLHPHWLHIKNGFYARSRNGEPGLMSRSMIESLLMRSGAR
jgi:hypothetical protein